MRMELSVHLVVPARELLGWPSRVRQWWEGARGIAQP